jgi:parvulin-like peptidyl-prolyl isomerase
MKYQLITALLLIASITATAQIASHATSAALQEGKLPAAQVRAMPVTGKPVAKVNGAVLTDKDLLREMYAIFPYARQHNGFPKGQEAEIRQGALQMIIFEELVYQEAERRRLRIPAAEIDQAEAAYRKTFDSPEQFQAFMQAEMQGSEKQLRDQIQRSLLIDQVLKQEVDNKAAVSAAELRTYYDKHLSRFTVPESYTFQSISVIPPRMPTPEQAKEARKKADDALQQAQATTSYQEFGLLAEKISEDDFRVNMGDHKAVPADKLPPQVIQAFQAMKRGNVSGLIQIESAYTIVRMNAHSSARKQGFSEVQAQLHSELQKQKFEQLRVNLAKRLRAKAKIEVV